MAFIDFLFPKFCISCKKTGCYLCADCIEKSRFANQICIECRRNSIDGLTHSKCKKMQSIDGIVSVWEYEGVIKKSILTLKYKFAYSLADILADNLYCYLKNNISALPKNALLIPIPLHPVRKNWRGFNQSEEIGKIVAKKMDWNYSDKLLIRNKNTIPQVKLKSEDRKKNLLGIFSVSPHITYNIYHIPIILFDDVSTTGTTIKEAGKMLKKAGFNKVWGLTLAK